jgi:cell fate regulator YaaT (PSP1 superfamily)
MKKVVGVRFEKLGKLYYCEVANVAVKIGDRVITQSAQRILDFATVVTNPSVITDEKAAEIESGCAKERIGSIKRIVTEADFKTLDENERKAAAAMEIAIKKVREANVPMQIVKAKYTFDSSKIIFYFTADGRVDFRKLVVTLAGTFHARIEMRQIGVRDEARQVGGHGVCGRSLCCATFLDNFTPVCLKMAKEQSLLLNPTKISGACGRYMCCLQFEQESYRKMLASSPKIGSIVDTSEGRAIVVENILLKNKVKVRFLDRPKDEISIKIFEVDKITVLEEPEESNEKYENENEIQ